MRSIGWEKLKLESWNWLKLQIVLRRRLIFKQFSRYIPKIFTELVFSQYSLFEFIRVNNHFIIVKKYYCRFRFKPSLMPVLVVQIFWKVTSFTKLFKVKNVAHIVKLSFPGPEEFTSILKSPILKSSQTLKRLNLILNYFIK